MKEQNLIYKESKIYYYTEGNPTNPAIVMLHPAFADHEIFKKQMEAWKERYYMIAIDMVSHGRSKNLKNGVNMGDMPAITSEILETLSIKRAHIIGVSLGSIVAQGVAYHYPDKIQSVTVVGGYSAHKENEHIMKVQKKEMGKWFRYILFSMKKFRAYVTEMSSYTVDSRDIFKRTLSEFRRRDFIGMNGMDKIMIEDSSQVPYPLLIICGEHDLLVAKEFGERWETIEPNGQYIEIDLAGHCANIDAPEAFNEVYEQFIAGIEE